MDNREISFGKNESKPHASKQGKFTVQQEGVDVKMGGDLNAIEQRIYSVAPTEISNVARKYHESGIIWAAITQGKISPNDTQKQPQESWEII